MKAIAKCPKCKNSVESEDRDMIERNVSFHECKDIMKEVGVKWKVYPQTEEEMMEIENNEN